MHAALEPAENGRVISVAQDKTFQMFFRCLPEEVGVQFRTTVAGPVGCFIQYAAVLYVKLEDYLFLPSACWTTKDRALNWQLTYDPTQQPVVENRKSIYSLYLRAAATTGKPEDKAEEAIAVINAFNLGNFIKDMREQGGRDAVVRRKGK